MLRRLICRNSLSTLSKRWIDLSGAFSAKTSAFNAATRYNLREVAVMQGDLDRRERREKELTALRDHLKQDPTNLELAHRYWNAMGPECGGAVFDAYRDAALASSAGTAAFARAYRELNLYSGEPPRCFDEPLIQALKTYLPELAWEDRVNVKWILEEIGIIPHALPSYARIWIQSGRLPEAWFEWLDFDGDDDCFLDFHIYVTNETGSHRFDFGPCAVNGLQKVSRFFRDRQEASVSGGFRYPDERYFEVHRTKDGYNLVVRFEGGDQNEQFFIPCHYLHFEGKFLGMYSQ